MKFKKTKSRMLAGQAGLSFGLAFLWFQAAAAQTVTWIGGSGDWDTATNWSTGVLPGATNDVVITNGPAITVTHSVGADIVNSIQSQQALVVSGGSLTASNTIQVNAAFTLSGGTIINATILPGTNGGGLIVSSGTLNNVKVNGTLDVGNTVDGATVTVTNNLVLDGTMLVGNPTNGWWGQVGFNGNENLTGNGTVIFGENGNDYLYPVNPSSALTIGPGITIEGQTGTIGSGSSYGSVINQGVISANVSGGTITINAQSFTNQGLVEGVNGGSLSIVLLQNSAGATVVESGGGSLNLVGLWDNAGTINATNSIVDLGGTFALTNLGTFNQTNGTVNLTGTLVNSNATLTLNAVTGSWVLNGGTVLGGTVVTSNGASLIVSSGTLNGVTVDGTLDVGNSYSGASLTVTNGLVLNGPALLGNPTNNTYGYMVFSGTQSLTGSGTVTFGRYSANQMYPSGISATLTIGPGITIEGQTGTIGAGSSYGSVINQGVISANVSGGTITINAQSFTNQGLVEGINGGSLSIVLLQNSAGATVVESGGGSLNLVGLWDNAGTINATNSIVDLGGTFALTNLGTFNQTNGTVNLTGTLVNSNATLTLNAVTGSWVLNGGTVLGGTVVTSNGASLIVSSGTLNAMTIDGTLDVGNSYSGATVTVTNGLVLNGPALLGNPTNNTYGYMVFSGTQSLTGSGTVTFGRYSANQIYPSGISATLTIGPGITIEGQTGIIGNGSSYGSVINQGVISANVSGGMITINALSFTNQGLVEGVNGGTLLIENAWSNSGTFVESGGTLNLAGSFTTAEMGIINQTNGVVELTGTLNNSNATVVIGQTNALLTLIGGTVQGGAITTTGGASFIISSGTLNGVSINGTLDVGNTVNATGLTVTNGLVLDGTMLVGNPTNSNYGRVNFSGNQSLTGNGTVVFGNAVYNWLSPLNVASSLTIGPGITIEGQTGALGQGNGAITNLGTISADVSGGTITIDAQPLNNQGLVEGVNGGTLLLENAWSNSGTLVESGGTLNLAGSFTTAGLGGINQTNGVVELTGTLNNSNATVVIGQTNALLTLNGGIVQGGTIMTTGGAAFIVSEGTLNGVSINGILDVGNSVDAASLTVTNGLVLDGTMLVGNPTNSYYGRVNFSGNQSLTGNGTVVFGDFVYNWLSPLNASSSLTIGPGITVEGQTGALGQGNGAITNLGTISADVSGGTITIDAQPFNNQGLVEGVNGGTLLIENAWSNSGTFVENGGTLNLAGSFTTAGLGNINQTNGVVELTGTLNNSNATVVIGQTNALLTLIGGTVQGGAITTTGGASFIISSGTLNGVSINGTLDVGNTVNAAGLTVTNGLVLDGTMLVGNPTNSNYGRVNFSGNQSLTGNGTVVFGNAVYNWLSPLNAASSLTIGPEITVEGQTGALGQGNGALTNLGTISANVSGGTITIDAQPFVNLGTLAMPTATIALSGSNILSGGTLSFGINSLASFGRMSVSGSILFGGSFNATLNNSYIPAVSNSFPLITYSSFTGSFTNTNLPPAVSWQTTYGATVLTIRVLQVAPPAAVVTWSNPAPIAYGTPLSSIQLNATASVSGSFAYTPTNGTVLSAGLNTLSVVFTPSNSAAYGNGTATVTLVVLPAGCTPPPPGLVNWWPGDGNALDIAGGNNGTLEGGVTFTTGEVGEAFSFNGSSSYVSVPNSPLWNFGSNNFSIAFWANFIDTNNVPAFIACDNGSAPQNKWIFFYGGAQQGLTFFLGGTAGYPNVDIGNFPFLPSPAQWYHIAMTRNGPSWTFYVNGSSIGTETNSNVVPIMTAPLTIGAAENSYYFNGLMDAVTIFDAALSSNQVAAIYAAGNAGMCIDQQPPVIATPPATQSATAGNLVTFTVSATGTQPLSYQWLFDATNLANNAQISGAQSNVLTLASAELSNAGTYQVIVNGPYGSTNASATLAVSKATQAITWTYPSSITYGTALNSNQLNATTGARGVFAYSPSNGVVLNAGTNTLSTFFTPTDTADYTNATATVTIVVLPAPLTVTASNATGQAGRPNPVFSGTITGVTNGDNITATFGTTATSNSPAGVYAITPTLVDLGHRLGNYVVTTNDGTFTITNAPGIVGTTVTGTLLFEDAGSNAFDPANGGVPAGFANSSGPTITIGAGENIFFYGQAGSYNFDSADFDGNTLTVTDTMNGSGAEPWTMTFVSAAFTNIAPVYDNFINGGIVASITSNTITLNWAGSYSPTYVLSGTYAAVFNVGSAAQQAGISISTPVNGASFTTNQSFPVIATVTGTNPVTAVNFYNGTNLLGTATSSPYNITLSNLAAGSYPLSAVATNNSGLSVTSAVVHVTLNVPGTTLIDFEALHAGTGPVSGITLSNYLAGYGVTAQNVTGGTTLAVQEDQNIGNGNVTKAYSGQNLLTQIGANGGISYTLLFNQPYTSISWVRTELLAGSAGVVTPAWTAYAYDGNGNEVGQVGEDQLLSPTTVPAGTFTLSGGNITSIIFAANNSIGAFDSLPLDNLLLSTNALTNPQPSITLMASSPTSPVPGLFTLTGQASESNGSISRIDFYENQVLIGSDTSLGGTNVIETLAVSGLAANTYTFYAVATDASGTTHSSSNTTVTVTPVPGVSVINFDASTLNTSAGAVGGVQLSNYLSGFGVTISNATLGTRLEAINENSFSGNELPVPSSLPNLFTQVGSSLPVTFTLVFASNQQSFSFTRVGMETNGPSGISHPAWTATAYDTNGSQLESASEPLIFSLSNIPPRSFTLIGSNIASVRIDSDSQQTAAFAAVLLDDLVLDANPAVSQLSISLAPPGGPFTAPANIPLAATATDNLTNIDHVAFYSGQTLIGSVSNSPYDLTWSNVLNGTYPVSAQVVDTAGYAEFSAPMTVIVTNQPGSGAPMVVNFDALNASSAPVTDGTLASYLGQNGMSLTASNPGTQVEVEDQTYAGGGGYVIASSPPNLLTQTGSNGPMSFVVGFSNLLTQFSFTRPELLANPFVTHPAWQVVALDPLGNVLASAQAPLISSYTNVPAQSYTFSNVQGIASVAVASSGTSLSTFPALLLDDFVLTEGTSVVITNPLPGQIITASLQIPLAAAAEDGSGTVTSVTFYYSNVLNGVNTPVGPPQSSPFSLVWNAPSNGSYTLTAIATNSSGLSVTSAPVAVTVATGFAITAPPVSQTVAAGNNVTFSVGTTFSNVAYQWQLNGSGISGATLSSYSISNAQSGPAQTYTVVATDVSQSITSPPAVLTVLGPPTVAPITQNPDTVIIGTNVTLTENASGAGTLSYQWELNGTGIAGATGSAYTISNAQPLNSGNYQVVVGNGVAFAQSPVYNLAVSLANGTVTTNNINFASSIPINPLIGPVEGINSNSPAIPGAGEPTNVIAGKPAGRFLWYNWTAGFTGVVSLTTRGSTFDTLLGVYTGSNAASLVPVVQDDDSGGFFTSLVSFNCQQGVTYQVAVAGFKGAAGTLILGLPSGTSYRVLAPNSGDTVPIITQQPASQIVPPGSNVTLSVTASNATSYQWYFAGAPVSGVNANTLVISNFTAGAAGNYYVLAVNQVGSVQSALAAVEIAAQNAGTPTTLTVDKFGDAVDLAGVGTTLERYRPEDGGGDTGGFTLSQSFSTVGATKDEGEPNHAGQAGGASYWYSFTALHSGTLEFNTAGSTFNTILAVYIGPGTSFNTLTNVGSAFTTNYLQQGQPVVTVSNVIQGTKYYIAIDGYLGASGSARLSVTDGMLPFNITTTPQSQTNIPGGNATFTANASGTLPFSYQWQLNGAAISGATLSSYTAAIAPTPATGSYSYAVIVSNITGAATSTPPSILTVQSSPWIEVQPVNGQIFTPLSVTAGGAPPLFYQWYFTPTNLITNLVTNAIGATFVPSNAGDYFVVVSNVYAPPATSSIVMVTPTNSSSPTNALPVFPGALIITNSELVVAITSPANNSLTTSSSISVRGTVRGSGGNLPVLTSLQVTVNTNAPTNATLGSVARGTIDWSYSLAAVPGANVVTVQAIDTNAAETNVSYPVTRTFFYDVTAALRTNTSQLTLLTNGNGKITGQHNPATLEIGKIYTVKAVPAAHWVFADWSNGTNSTNLSLLPGGASLSFDMSAGLILQANFTNNPFTNVAGAYNGLFYPATGMSQETSGYFTATLAATGQGAYSAKLLLGGDSYPFSGTFDLSGDAEATVAPTSKAPLTVYLHLDLGAFDNQMTGYVINNIGNGWISEITANRVTFSKSKTTTEYAGKYNLIIPPGSNAPASEPAGYSYATVTSTSAGAVSITGSLADKTSISQSTTVSENGNIPLYASLYSKKGLLLGWLTLTNATNGQPAQTILGTNVAWIKTNIPKALYSGGFTNTNLAVFGSLYTNNFTLTGGVLTLSNATMTAPLIYSNLAIVDNKLVTNGNPPNKLTGAITTSTGVLTVTFQPSLDSHSDIVAKGVILEDNTSTNAAGWFLDATNSGYFLLLSQ